jgi:DNA-binding LytR/AlgR family response regulator
MAVPGISVEVLRNWMAGLKIEKEYKKRFMVQAGSRIKTIPVTDIAYFFFLEGDTYFCTRDNRRFPADQSLDRLEDLLHPDSFFRVNRKMIVSFGCIDKIFTLSRSRIKLVLIPPFDEEVLVSFNKAPAFRNWLNR